MIKYIAIDLDGTLLNSDGKVGELSKREISHFCRNGGKLIIVSGRHFDEIQGHILEMPESIRPITICCDGVYICQPDGRILEEGGTLSKEDAKIIMMSLKLPWVDCYTYRHDIRVYNSWIYYLRYILKSIINGKVEEHCRIFLYKFSSFMDEKIEKIVYYTLANSVQEDSLKEKYTIHIYDDGRREVLSHSVNKYVALKRLEELGIIDLTELLYFGDNVNDIECFEHLSHTVAMKDANDIIKKKAKYITESNDTDGVGRCLEQLNIINWRK